MTALASRPPGSLALELHSEHVTEQGRALRGIGAVCAYGVHPADRDVPVDVRGIGEERLVPAVIDHQFERQPVRVREQELIRPPIPCDTTASQTALPEIKRLRIRHPHDQAVDHPSAGSASWSARHVEKRDDAAGSAALVAVGDVPHLRVVRVHSLPYQPQSK